MCSFIQADTKLQMLLQTSTTVQESGGSKARLAAWPEQLQQLHRPSCLDGAQSCDILVQAAQGHTWPMPCWPMPCTPSGGGAACDAGPPLGAGVMQARYLASAEKASSI